LLIGLADVNDNAAGLGDFDASDFEPSFTRGLHYRLNIGFFEGDRASCRTLLVLEAQQSNSSFSRVELILALLAHGSNFFEPLLWGQITKPKAQVSSPAFLKPLYHLLVEGLTAQLGRLPDLRVQPIVDAKGNACGGVIVCHERQVTPYGVKCQVGSLSVWLAQQEGELAVNILRGPERHEAAPHDPAFALDVLPYLHRLAFLTKVPLAAMMLILSCLVPFVREIVDGHH
jgi:hypothetical protein